jgi:hypothetical protein
MAHHPKSRASNMHHPIGALIHEGRYWYVMTIYGWLPAKDWHLYITGTQGVPTPATNKAWILLDAKDEADACDLMSAFLTEGGIYERNPDDPEHDTGIIDWSYAPFPRQGFYNPVMVELPDDYDRDEEDLDEIATLARR